MVENQATEPGGASRVGSRERGWALVICNPAFGLHQVGARCMYMSLPQPQQQLGE